MAVVRLREIYGVLLVVVALSSVVGCTPPLGDSRIGDIESPPHPIITVTSGVFGNGDPIPMKYLCTNELYELSPPLEWSGVPEDANGLVLVVDNPDEDRSEDSTAVWIAALDPSATSLAPGVSNPSAVGNTNPRQGELFSVELDDPPGYVGTCPTDVEQRLRFTIYALSDPLEEDQAKNSRETLWHIKDYWIASGRLTGIVPAE